MVFLPGIPANEGGSGDDEFGGLRYRCYCWMI